MPSLFWLRWACRVLVTGLMMLVAPAHAERHALLVGVSSYPGLPRDKQLQGPVNDVLLMRRLLLERGFSQARLQVLAEPDRLPAVPGARVPTRENILAAVNELATRVKPGDFVFLYLAGHGSQMPTDASVPVPYRKPDGRQEIFLPRDARAWDQRVGQVPNAIADHELTAAVDKMRENGAFVWAVVDACHSATLVRGPQARGEGRDRFVSPEELGIPSAAFEGDRPVADDPARGLLVDREPELQRGESAKTRPAGGFVAFYAAQQHETTPEDKLPEDSDDRAVRGLFTYWLSAAISLGEGATYRQLGAYVRQQYAARNRQMPTPQFTGTHLDAVAFGQQAAAQVHQWPLQTEGGNLAVGAGELQQLVPGSVLAVVATPLARDGDAIGYVRVLRASLLKSTVQGFEHRGKPALAIASVPKGSYVRMLQPRLDFTLRVALVPALKGAIGARDPRGIAKGALPEGLKLAWVKPEQDHDIRLEVAAGRLWLAPRGAVIVREGPGATPSIGLSDSGLEATLGESLGRIAKALNVLRIAAALEAGNNDRNMRVSATLDRNGVSKPFDAATVLDVRSGDHILVTVQNLNEHVALDVTALYLDSRYGIQSMPPVAQGTTSPLPDSRCGAARLAPNRESEGGSRRTFGFTIDASTVGLERLMLIAVDAVSMRECFDFGFLAQDSLPASREVRRGESGSDITALFEEAGFGAAHRDIAREGTPVAPMRSRIDVLSFKVRARP